MATVEQVRELYAETTASCATIPRNGYFGRELVGVLLAEIDRLQAMANAQAERIAAQSELLSRQAEGGPS